MGGGKTAATEPCGEQLLKKGLSAAEQPGVRLAAPQHAPTAAPGLPPALGEAAPPPVSALETQSRGGDLGTKGGLVK